jgi:hypothetical protein
MCERGEPCDCRDLSAPGTGGVSGPGAMAHSADSEPGLAEGADAAPAAAGDEVKRVELRLRSSHDLWLAMGPWTFYKDRERAESCFYIDVPVPGVGERPISYPIELRASNADGVSAELVIQELGVAARSWYQTFRFSCGFPGACSFDELDGLKAAARRAVESHTLYDPCGSMRVRGLQWDTRVAPDHANPGDLTLTLTLELFRFTPDKPHGDPSCQLR